MKKVLVFIAFAIVVVSCKVDSKNKVETSEAKEITTESASEVLVVDAENSIVNWKGFKPGGEHYGTISISQGTIDIKDGRIVGGKFTFDMNTIVDLDMEPDNEYNAKLVNHLKSKDFFDVEKYPTATFIITSVTVTDGKLSISGNLTAKKVTKNITIPAVLAEENGVMLLVSDPFKVDRTEFGIQFKSKKFFDNLGDKFLNDLFEMSFAVKAPR